MEEEKIEGEVKETGITLQQLHDHILKHMTAEQAMKMMLEGMLIEYQHLRFSSQEDAIHPSLLIVMAALEMGWSIAIRKGNDDDPLDGITVGTDEYIRNEFKTKDPLG